MSQTIWFFVDVMLRTPFNTGIQRVGRALARATQGVGAPVRFIRWDLEAKAFIGLSAAECAYLAKWNGPAAEPARGVQPDIRPGDWVITPDILMGPGPTAEQAIAAARGKGARMAFILYDLIPLKLSPKGRGRRTDPIHTMAEAAAFETFWRQVSRADAILPISRSVGEDYLAHIRRACFKLGNLERRTIPILLGADFDGRERGFAPPAKGAFGILNVATIEPRKNQITLIRAFRAAAERPSAPPMRLVVAGSDRMHPTLAQRLRDAADGDSRITFVSDADDETLARLYRECHLVCSASYEEGFGLPVVEALRFGRPCLAHNEGALAEISEGGGVRTLDMLDEKALADAIFELAVDRDALDRLAAEARARPVRTWRDYAHDVLSALSRLSPPLEDAGPAISGTAGGIDAPLLSICVLADEAAPEVSGGLRRLRSLAQPYGDAVEIAVFPEASGWRRAIEAARGDHVWRLGARDTLTPGAIGSVLECLLDQPGLDLLALNHARAADEQPALAADADALIRSAIAAAPQSGDQTWIALADAAALDPDVLSLAASCVARRDFALAALDWSPDAAADAGVAAMAPLAAYGLLARPSAPAAWLSHPSVVVDHARPDPLRRLACLPALFDLAEWRGASAVALDRYRLDNLQDAAASLRDYYASSKDASHHAFHMEYFIASHLHLDAFRARILAPVRAAYRAAHAAGRTPPGAVSPDELDDMFDLGRL